MKNKDVLSNTAELRAIIDAKRDAGFIVEKDGGLGAEERNMLAIHREAEKDRLAVESAESARIQAEILSHPPRTFISRKQLENLRKKGEVVITGVHLYGRQLKSEDEIILLDEEMREIPAQFIGITTIGDKKNTDDDISIKVQLPKEPKS